MTAPGSSLSQRIAETLRRGGDRPAVEFEEVWSSWTDLNGLAADLNALLDARAPGARRIGLIVRNRPVDLAAMLGLIASGRSIVMINAAQAPERLAGEIAALKLAAVVGAAALWAGPVTAAAEAAGSLQVVLPDRFSDPVTAGNAPQTLAADAHDPTVAMELLSSGTTGPPKRIPILWRTLEAALGSAHGTPLFGEDADALAQAELPPAISGLSLGNIGGVYMILPSALVGQRIVLLDRFAVAPWARAVRLYRPDMLSVQPVGLRMILDAEVPPEDLSSLKWIVSGASHLDPDLQYRFEARYGCRVFGAYGATEFCGSIVLWTDALYDEFRQTKRGSVGRPAAGVEARIVDPESGTPLPPRAIGLFEARVERVGPGWIRTTDLAFIDEDGFVFITGRADNVINRGGYKVSPDEVGEVLKRHPAVLDAAVIGLPDARLGEVPVAAVELRPGQAPPSEEELKEFARRSLMAYQVPARIVCTEALPRNASLKVMAPAVRELFQP